MSQERDRSERQQELLRQAKAFLDEFNGWLPQRIDPAGISRKSKVPFKVMSHSAALLYRMTELGEAAYQLYKTDRLAAAFTLTRSSLETAAMLFWLYDKVRTAVDRSDLGDMDQHIMRGIFGGRDKEAKLPAFNVLTIIEHADRKLKVWKAACESLSEYAHPNFSGTLSLYGRYNTGKSYLELGWEIKGKIRRGEGLPLLVGALAVFKYYYQAIQGLMPRFVGICET